MTAMAARHKEISYAWHNFGKKGALDHLEKWVNFHDQMGKLSLLPSYHGIKLTSVVLLIKN